MIRSLFAAAGLISLMFFAMEGKVSAQGNNITEADFTDNTTLEGGIGTQILFSRDAGVLDFG